MRPWFPTDHNLIKVYLLKPKASVEFVQDSFVAVILSLRSNGLEQELLIFLPVMLKTKSLVIKLLFFLTFKTTRRCYTCHMLKCAIVDICLAML